MIADAKYGTAANLAALDDQGIRAAMPLSAAGTRPGIFPETDFIYDPDTDTYRCPAGQTLRYRTLATRTQHRIYAATAKICADCPLRAQCTTSSEARKIRRGPFEPSVDRLRDYHTTAAYAKAMRKRQVWVEPLFAEAKAWHGLRRLRLRGLINANIQGLLIAAGQNLKRFLAASGWGRRHAPCGSLVALPRELPRLAIVSG